jgi:hypothetical protein
VEGALAGRAGVLPGGEGGVVHADEEGAGDPLGHWESGGGDGTEEEGEEGEEGEGKEEEEDKEEAIGVEEEGG